MSRISRARMTASYIGAGIIGNKGPTIDYGALAAGLGDSIMQQNSQGNAVSGDTTRGAVNIRGVGEMAQVMSLDPRVTFVDWYDPNKTIGSAGGASRLTDGSNQGANSQTSTEIRARVGDLIARNIKVAIVAMGTNNTTQFATVTADIQATVQALRGAASPVAVILATIRPNTVENEANSTRKKVDIQAINVWIRTYVASLNDAGVVLWDAYAQYDRGDGYLDPLDAYDKLLHPSERGAELGAWGNDPVTPAPNSLTAAIRKLVKPGNTYADIIAANANLLANPTFTGSVASNNSPISGVAPTGWQWSPQGTPASAIVASLEANAETGGQTAVATITPSGSSDFERINFRLTSFTQAIANLSAKWVRAFFEVETDGAPYLMTPVGILLAMDSSNTAKEIANALQVAGQSPPGTYRGPMRPVARRRLIMTDPILCKADATGLQPYLQIGFMPTLANGAAAKVKVRRAWLGIVPDPRVAFGQAT